MIPADVLARLQDIETPPVAGPWPPAPGWWLLAILITGLLVLAGFLVWYRRRRTAPKREALARIARLGAPEQAGTDWYADLNRLLKQSAMYLYATDSAAYNPANNPANNLANNPASLSGDQWRDFLARTSDIPGHRWQALVEASYRPGSDLPPAQARELAAHWIRRQRW